MSDTAPKRRRGGGRSGNATRRGGAVIEQMPWRLPVNVDRPTEPLTQEGVLAIHDGAMRILEEVGIEFLNHEALEILRKAGCTINGENVRMGRDFVMEWIAKAPSQWTLTPRNLDRELTIGGNYMLFGNVSSPPNYWVKRRACQEFSCSGMAANDTGQAAASVASSVGTSWGKSSSTGP